MNVEKRQFWKNYRSNSVLTSGSTIKSIFKRLQYFFPLIRTCIRVDCTKFLDWFSNNQVFYENSWRPPYFAYINACTKYEWRELEMVVVFSSSIHRAKLLLIDGNRKSTNAYCMCCTVWMSRLMKLYGWTECILKVYSIRIIIRYNICNMSAFMISAYVNI